MHEETERQRESVTYLDLGPAGFPVSEYPMNGVELRAPNPLLLERDTHDLI